MLSRQVTNNHDVLFVFLLSFAAVAVAYMPRCKKKKKSKTTKKSIHTANSIFNFELKDEASKMLG